MTTENQNALAAIDRGLSRIEPSLWVVSRQRVLRTEASTMSAGVNVAKTTSIAGAVVAGGVGLLAGATGVGAVCGAVCLVTYGAVLVADLLDTGRFAPIPFMRTRVFDRLETLGNAETRELRSAYDDAQQGAGRSSFEADEELYSNLPQELCNEALMLSKHGRLIINMLGQLPAEQRDLAYVQLCSMYSKFGDSLTGLSLQRLKDSMEGRIGGNYSVMRPAEIHEYQAPVYQVGAGDRSFGELPAAMPVGNATRLGAVDVPTGIAQPDKKSAYQAIIASPYRSRFFLGGQRTGKSYLAIHCAQAGKEKGADIYYLNLSAWGAEDDGYSSIAVKSITANIQGMTTEQAESEIEAARKLLQAFFISDKPAILVLEEWCELGSRNHQHKAQLESLLAYSASIVEQLANTGQKRRKAVYATGPMFVAGSLQQATKAAKSMALVLVAIAPAKTVYWQEQALSFDPAVFSMALANWHGVIEPVGSYTSDRIALVDGQWLPVGDLPALPEQPRRPVAPAAITAPVTEDFGGDEATPAPKTSALIPGLSKTLPEAADMVARYLQKNEGQEATMGAIAKVFRSDDRDAIRPLLQSICLSLVTESPGNYIYKCGSDGKAKICYQAEPLLGQKWTGDEE